MRTRLGRAVRWKRELEREQSNGGTRRERGVGGFKERRSRVGIWLEVVANVM